MDKPLEYYRNNFVGTVVLLEVMRKHNMKNVSVTRFAGSPGACRVQVLLIRPIWTRPHPRGLSLARRCAVGNLRMTA